MKKISEFFKKTWMWLKSTCKKVYVYALAHKPIAAAVLGGLVVALTLAIVLPGAISNGKNKSNSQEPSGEVSPGETPPKEEIIDNTPPADFDLDITKKAKLIKQPTESEQGELRLFGTFNMEDGSVVFKIATLSNTTYYSKTHTNPTCENDSSNTYTFIDSPLESFIKTTYSLSDADSSSFYKNKVKVVLPENIVTYPAEHDALGHDWSSEIHTDSKATSTEKGKIHFECKRDSSHKIEYDTPILTSDNYDIDVLNQANCIKKKSSQYTQKDNRINDFLNKTGKSLYSDDTSKKALADAIKASTKQVLEEGSVNLFNHEGDVYFDLKGHEPTYSFDESEDNYASIDNTSSIVTARCGDCTNGIGNSEEFYFSDGKWKIENDTAKRYYDIEFDSKVYKDIESVQTTDNFYVRLHSGSEVSFSGIQKSRPFPVTDNHNGYVEVVDLAKITWSTKSAATINQEGITMYVDGEETPITETTEEINSLTPYWCYRKGNGLYFFIGKYFGFAKYLYANIDIVIDFDY